MSSSKYEDHFSFAFNKEFTLDTPLSEVIRQAVPDPKKADDDGYLLLLKCQTGLGKTYSTAAHILDQLIDAAHPYGRMLAECASLIQNASDSLGPNASATANLEACLSWLLSEATYSLPLSLLLVQLENELLKLQERLRASDCDPDLVDKLLEASASLKALRTQLPLNAPIVVITDTRDNVANFHEELLNLIRTDDRFNGFHKAFLLRRVLYLPNNADHLRQFAREDIEQVIARVAPHDHEIEALWQEVCSLESHAQEAGSSSGELNKKIQADRDDAARAFYAEFAKRTGRAWSAALSNPTGDNLSLLQSLYALYPANYMVRGDAHAFFMTTKKYLFALTSCEERFVVYMRFSQHQLIIDEVDKQNAVIRDHLLDIDPIKLVSALKTVIPSDIINEIETGPIFDGVSEQMSSAIRGVQDARRKWCLDQSFDFQMEGYDQTPVQLFSARGQPSVLVAGGNDKEEGVGEPKWIEVVPASQNDRNINMLRYRPDGAPASMGENSFTYLVNQLNVVFDGFVNAIKLSAFKVYSNWQKQVPEQASMAASLQTIISQYNLGSIQGVLKSAVHGGTRLTQPLERCSLSTANFHLDGFNYTRVTREGASYNTVELETYSLGGTPTGMVCSLVQAGAKIIALSATADARTSVHNFDIPALESFLGERLITLDKAAQQRLIDFYDSKRNYKKAGVSIEVQFYGDDMSIFDPLFGGDQLTRNLGLRAAVGSNEQGKHTGSEPPYAASELSKVLQAITSFITAPHSRYMLCLTTRLIGKKDEERELIEKLVALVAKEAEIPVQTFFKINAQAMKAGEFEVIRQTLATSNDKVIVFSSYASMGAGKNPDYVPQTQEDIAALLLVDEQMRDAPQKADIDTIFLGRPTNLFPLNDDERTYVSSPQHKMSALYNIMCLKESDVIDSQTAKSWARMALNDNNKSRLRRELQHRYMGASFKTGKSGAPDYRAALAKFIGQAVGRMARTAYKRAQINVYADMELAPYLSEVPTKGELISHEFAAMAVRAREICEQEGMRSLSALNDHEALKVKAGNSNRGSHLLIMDKIRLLFAQNRRKGLKAAEYLEERIRIFSQLKITNLDELLGAIEREELSLEYDYVPHMQNTQLFEKLKGGCHRANREALKQTGQPAPIAKLHQACTKRMQKHVADYSQSNRAVYQDWESLRRLVLKSPSLGSLENVNVHWCRIFIEVPDKEASEAGYAYTGIPEKENLDAYRFFDGFADKPKYVSCQQARLQEILKCPAVKDHFINEGFALDWQPAKFIITPVIFSNVYRPAIAEQACQAILTASAFQWHALPEGLEEYFDAIIEDGDGNRVLVDVKYYSAPHDAKENLAAKFELVSKETGIERLAFINLFYDEGSSVQHLSADRTPALHNEAKIIDIPGLLYPDGGHIQHEHISQLRMFMSAPPATLMPKTKKGAI